MAIICTRCNSMVFALLFKTADGKHGFFRCLKCGHTMMINIRPVRED